MNYYQHSSTLKILEHHIGLNEDNHGYKAKLAAAAGCQRSYLSQVLSGVHTLNPDHVLGIADFWGARDEERDYMLDLVHLERAGSKKLRDLYHRRVQAAKSKAIDLTNRFKAEPLPVDALTFYYSHWLYAAVHIALTVANFQTPDALHRRFSLPKEHILKVLATLVDAGLAAKMGERYIAKKQIVHLPKDSPYHSLNHSTWRQYAIHKIFQANEEELHFSGVYSLSKEDAVKLRDMIISFIEETRRLVALSREEEVTALLLDYFVI